MPYPVATWDELEMGRPQSAGMVLGVPSMLVRSQDLSAEPLYTRVSVKRSRELQVEVQMSLSQWEYFREFFESTLRHGMAWFTMKLYVGTPADYTVHIAEYDVSWLADDLAVLSMDIEVAR